MTDTPHHWRPERFMVIAGHPDDADFLHRRVTHQHALDFH